MSDPEKIKQIEAAYAEGRLEDTERLGNEILQEDRRCVPALFLTGLVAARSGRLSLAVERFRAAIAADPTTFPATNELANLMRVTGHIGQAIEFAQTAIRLQPENPHGHKNLGLCYVSTQQFEEATECFQRAVALQPEAAIHRHNLGVALESEGRTHEAADSYRKAIELQPKLPITQIRLGQLLLTMGGRDEAIRLFQDVLIQEPNNAEAHLLLGEAFREMGNLEESQEHLRLAGDIDPRLGVSQGFRYQTMGRFDDARAAFERALEANPRLGASYYGIVSGRKITEDDRPFLETISNVLRDPRLPQEDRMFLQYAAGKANDDLKDYRLAMRHFDEANGIAARIIGPRQVGLSFDPKRHSESIDWRIKTFTKEFFAKYAGFGSTDETPVFIVGMIRSGTSLTEQLLSSHPQIAGGGELRFWYSRQKELNQTVSKGHVDKAAIGRLADDALTLLHSIAPDATRVTDKLPMNYLILGLIRLAFPKAKIIHCKRNAVDNCLSIYTTYFDVSPSYAHVPENIVAYYQQYERLMAHWRAVLPSECFMEVNYEDIVADREGNTRAMVEFLGLEWNDAVLSHEKNERAVRTPSLWQVRQPIYKTSVERWRNYEPWLGAFRALLD